MVRPDERCGAERAQLELQGEQLQQKDEQVEQQGEQLQQKDEKLEQQGEKLERRASSCS